MLVNFIFEVVYEIMMYLELIMCVFYVCFILIFSTYYMCFLCVLDFDISTDYVCLLYVFDFEVWTYYGCVLYVFVIETYYVCLELFICAWNLFFMFEIMQYYLHRNFSYFIAIFVDTIFFQIYTLFSYLFSSIIAIFYF